MTAASKVFTFVAAVFFICFESFGDDARDVSKVFGGKETAAIIARPDSAKAWRTLGSIEKEQHEQGKRADFDPADYYRKSGDPVVVSSNQAAQLSRLLLDKDSYRTIGASTKDCIAEPGVVVTFSEGNKSVDVFFCFECKILVVNNIGSDFDPGCPAFLQIIKEIFPNDREIQSLKGS